MIAVWPHEERKNDIAAYFEGIIWTDVGLLCRHACLLHYK